MNIMFFLTPKQEVSYIFDDSSFRQALEKMEHSHYSALPIIKRTGEYVGTLNEGDMLQYLKRNSNLNLVSAQDVPIMSVPRRSDNTPVFANNEIDEMYEKALTQNFVPVVDSRGIFVGIVTRRAIFKYLYKEHQKAAEQADKESDSARRNSQIQFEKMIFSGYHAR